MKNLNTVKDHFAYRRGIVVRINHHAQNLNNIVDRLLFAVLVTKHPQLPTACRIYGKRTGNVLWFTSQRGVEYLLKAKLRWSPAGVALSRSLHPPRGHF